MTVCPGLLHQFGLHDVVGLGCQSRRGDGLWSGSILAESMAMWPGAEVSGWYFAHPESQYFVVGRIGRDQVSEYATRKGWTLSEAERWLAPNFDYVPED